MGTETRMWALAMLVSSVVVTGCASTNSTAVGSLENTERTSVYSTLDSTALVYTDPMAGAPADDNPWRWVGFLLNPAGLAVDYAVNRPIYTLGSHLQRATGYTAEDAMLDASRKR